MKKATPNRLPPEAREAIRTYLRGKTKKQAVSTFDAIQEVRSDFLRWQHQMPSLPTASQELPLRST